MTLVVSAQGSIIVLLGPSHNSSHIVESLVQLMCFCKGYNCLLLLFNFRIQMSEKLAGCFIFLHTCFSGFAPQSSCLFFEQEFCREKISGFLFTYTSLSLSLVLQVKCFSVRGSN